MAELRGVGYYITTPPILLGQVSNLFYMRYLGLRLSFPINFKINNKLQKYLQGENFSTNTILPRKKLCHGHICFREMGWQSLKRAQMLGTWSCGAWRWEWWSCEDSDSNTDDDWERQKKPPATWLDWPLDPLPHSNWQRRVTHTHAPNNNLRGIW